MKPSLEAIAQELSRRPHADRGRSVVELMTQIDGELQVQHPDMSEGQRGGVVLKITHDVVDRCIEIDREALKARRGRLL